MNLKNNYILLFFLTVLVTQGTLFSQDNIQTDRPDQTESPFIVPLNQFQWETGSLLDFSDQSTKWTINTSLFRYALHKNLELRFVANVLRNIPANSFLNPINGMSDLEFGLKYKLFEGPFQCSFLTHTLIPTGNESFSAGSFGINSRITIAHAITKWMSLGYNFGYIYGSEYQDTYLGTCSAAFSLTEQLGYFIEWYGNTEQFDKIYSNMDTGFTWLYKSNIQLDLSYGFSFDVQQNFISVGCSFLSKQ